MVGMILSLCFGLHGSSPVRAQGSATESRPKLSKPRHSCQVRWRLPLPWMASSFLCRPPPCPPRILQSPIQVQPARWRPRFPSSLFGSSLSQPSPSEPSRPQRLCPSQNQGERPPTKVSCEVPVFNRGVMFRLLPPSPFLANKSAVYRQCLILISMARFQNRW